MHSCFFDNMSAWKDFAGIMQDRKHIFQLLLNSIEILVWVVLCY